MDATRRDHWLQRGTTVQQELLPQLKQETGGLTPKLEPLIHILEWVRIEEPAASDYMSPR